VTSFPGSGLLRWAEVNVAALRRNAAAFRQYLPDSTRLLVMVKSNGYGHGAEIAARAAVEGGADWLGVYAPDEALALRAAGFNVPILIVGWSAPSLHRELIEQKVDITVFDTASIGMLSANAAAVGQRARVHVKVDTGLGRLGVREEQLADVQMVLEREQKHLDVCGLFTHFAVAESDAEFTREQHGRFLESVDVLRPVMPEALLHTSGSAAILNFPEMHHDMVRLGIAYYGYAPAGAATSLDLRIAMTVLARIAQVKTVAAGDSVGYGRTWRASSRRCIATVAIGYGQGLPRALSNRGTIVVHGAMCPIVGTVSMDQVTVDVSDVAGVREGTEAMYFGVHDAAKLGADAVASAVNTIPHEILCAVADWVPRLPVEADL
jgi:alanine racemase